VARRRADDPDTCDGRGGRDHDGGIRAGGIWTGSDDHRCGCGCSCDCDCDCDWGRGWGCSGSRGLTFRFSANTSGGAGA